MRRSPRTYVRCSAPLNLFTRADTLTAWTYFYVTLTVRKILVRASVILRALSNEPCTATSSKTHALCIQAVVVGNQSAVQAGNKCDGCDFKTDSSATTPRD